MELTIPNLLLLLNHSTEFYTKGKCRMERILSRSMVNVFLQSKFKKNVILTRFRFSCKWLLVKNATKVISRMFPCIYLFFLIKKIPIKMPDVCSGFSLWSAAPVWRVLAVISFHTADIHWNENRVNFCLCNTIV